MALTEFPDNLDDLDDLRHRQVAVVASGPSLTGVDLHKELAGMVVIANGSYLRSEVDGPVADIICAADVSQLGWVRDYGAPVQRVVTHHGKHNQAIETYRLYGGLKKPANVDDYRVFNCICDLLPGEPFTVQGSLALALVCAQLLDPTVIRIYGVDLYQIEAPDGRRLMFSNYDEKLNRYAEWSEVAGSNALGAIMISTEEVDRWSLHWSEASRLDPSLFLNMSADSQIKCWPFSALGFPRD